MRYLIIGNSAAGVSAAETIRGLDKSGQIDIISDERYPAYARCLTSYYLAGQMSDEQMMIRNADFYARNKIILNTGQKATGIDAAARVVRTDNGHVYSYDKLLIATGASPVIPDIPGAEMKGVFGLRTLDDAKGIAACAGQGGHAVVMGGGFVSLKAAYALLKAGLRVTCIVSSGQILSQMLDREAARILGDLLISHGLDIKFYADAAEIAGESIDGVMTAHSVKLTTGETIPADVVIIGKGVTPNTGFLSGSGIDTDRGILVNEHLETTVPDIYAAGDVAQALDILTGQRSINAIWPNAAEQGTAAGRNMAGSPVVYEGSLGMNSADFFGLSTIAAGNPKAEGDEYEVVKLFPGCNIYRRLVFKGDNLIGYIMVGKTARAGILTSLIREKVPLGSAKNELKQGHIRQRLVW
ncbi:NAD(P)/FAD-dependent oxidoreductase [Phosphitispora fastidiosa]|uniref:NAD(P)/FAD-dependent oxidoreductase n=1 Tax=Phosphitispora fastidiosa TaxID=2837202 RepID=UPI001E3EC78A|nr:NAD(P)H-nitrite reductase large subunit [Phosphitispora fastidiosa]